METVGDGQLEAPPGNGGDGCRWRVGSTTGEVEVANSVDCSR